MKKIITISMLIFVLMAFSGCSSNEVNETLVSVDEGNGNIQTSQDSNQENVQENIKLVPPALPED